MRYQEEEITNLATEMLMLQSEEELDHFFGDLIKKAAGGISRFASSSVGKALTSGLKTVAKAALPTVAGAVGNMIAPGIGGAIGGKLGSMAAGALEAEGEEEAFESDEIEKAKQIIKVADAATKKVKAAPAGADIREVVRSAIMDAVEEFAPSLKRSCNKCGRSDKGHWYRRGNKIVIVGA